MVKFQLTTISNWETVYSFKGIVVCSLINAIAMVRATASKQLIENLFPELVCGSWAHGSLISQQSVVWKFWEIQEKLLCIIQSYMFSFKII